MRHWLRPSLETVAVYGLLGWIYVAAYAAARPTQLSVPITALVPIRRDTFGVLCFAISALAAAALQAGTGRVLVRGRAATGVVAAALRTVAGYAFLVWTYLCVNSLTHPYTLRMRLTHFAAVPTEGTAATSCFLLSIAAFLGLRLRELRPNGEA